MKLTRAAVAKEVFCPDHLAVKCAGDQRFVFDFAGFGIGDGDVVDLESAPQRAFVVGFGLLEIGERAEFGALRGDEVALGENDVVNGGGSEPVFFLLRVKGFLLEFARLAGGIHLGAVLRERDVGVAHVEKRGIFQLLQLVSSWR